MAIRKLPLATRNSGNENLRLHFTPSGRGPTYTKHKYATYPFHVGRVLYMDHSWPEVATVYIQSASGGIFQDDRLATRIQVDPRAAAHVTTQGSTKIHSMERGYASEHCSLIVSKDGILEYLADPFILFPSSDFRSHIHVDIEQGGSCIVSDGYIVHSPTEGSVARFTRFQSDISVNINGNEVAIDRTVIDDAAGVGRSIVGMQGYPMNLTVLLILPDLPILEALARIREELDSIDGLYAGASSLRSEAGIVVRMQSHSGTTLRKGQTAAWRAFRAMAADKGIEVRRK